MLYGYIGSLLERLIPLDMGCEVLEISTKCVESLHPSISVIVPIYNVGFYIKHCIDSILKQTFTDFELLLINDGSTDYSGHICNEYCEKDTRCKIVHKENNKGVADARNTGLDLAMGDYIAFIDADDYVHPQYLEILYKTICENEYEISVVDFENVSTMYFEASYKTKNYYNTRLLLQNDLMAGLFSTMLFMVVWGKLYKRELLQRIRFKSFYMIEDIEFNSRVYQTIQRAAVVDAKLYYWMNNPSSKMRVLFSQRNIDAIECYKFSLDNIQENRILYRAYALQRLYKVILYTRYNATLGFNTAVRSKVKPIVNCTISEFIHNQYIPLAQKYSLLLFYYIPFLYRFFRWWLNRLAKSPCRKNCSNMDEPF